MGNKNKTRTKRRKSIGDRLYRAHCTPSISAVFESLPLSSSEIRSDGKHDFWSDHIGRGDRERQNHQFRGNSGWTARNERMMIQRASLFCNISFYIIMPLESLSEFRYKRINTSAFSIFFFFFFFNPFDVPHLSNICRGCFLQYLSFFILVFSRHSENINKNRKYLERCLKKKKEISFAVSFLAYIEISGRSTGGEDSVWEHLQWSLGLFFKNTTVRIFLSCLFVNSHFSRPRYSHVLTNLLDA